MSVVRRNLTALTFVASLRAEVVQPYCGGAQIAPSVVWVHPLGDGVMLPRPRLVHPRAASTAPRTPAPPSRSHRALAAAAVRTILLLCPSRLRCSPSSR